jgi:hypothetical protein
VKPVKKETTQNNEKKEMVWMDVSFAKKKSTDAR